MVEDFDNYADNYEQLLAASLKGFGAEMAYYRRRKAAIARSICPGPVGSFLEYGCGTGGNLPFLRNAFPKAKAAGCDVSAASLAVAAAAAPWAEIFPSDGDAPLGSHDVVFVANVFHHVPVPDRPALAARMASALRPGGTLLIFEHNPYNPVTRRIVSTCPFDADAKLLRPAETAGLLAGAGLTGIRQRYTLFFPASLALLAGLERFCGRIPLGGQYVSWGVAAR